MAPVKGQEKEGRRGGGGRTETNTVLELYCSDQNGPLRFWSPRL